LAEVYGVSHARVRVLRFANYGFNLDERITCLLDAYPRLLREQALFSKSFVELIDLEIGGRMIETNLRWMLKLLLCYL